jgi:predicted acetyltransferase
MGEFFILARFQGNGIGRRVAHQIWNEHQGKWEVSVIPENVSALTFWRKAVSEFTNGNYFEEIKTIDYEQGQQQRYILSFDTTKVL